LMGVSFNSRWVSIGCEFRPQTHPYLPAELVSEVGGQ
jgi:hypothetical protein